jgi:hypothetical protein
MWTEGSDEGLFYLGVVIGPVVLVAALSPPYLFPRYFLLSALFLLVIAARQLARLLAGRSVSRAVAVLLLAGFVIGNGVHAVTLVRERHGQLPAALRMVAGTVTDPSDVTSPSLDQWTELPLRFYARRSGLSDRFRYVARGSLPRIGAVDWAINPAQPCGPPPASRVTLPSGQAMGLTRSFDVCGPSGMAWAIYGAAPLISLAPPAILTREGAPSTR